MIAKRRFDLDTKEGTTLATWVEENHMVVFAYMEQDDIEAVLHCGNMHECVNAEMNRIIGDSPILGKAMFAECERKVAIIMFKKKVKAALDMLKANGFQPREVANYVVPPLSIAHIIEQLQIAYNINM